MYNYSFKMYLEFVCTFYLYIFIIKKKINTLNIKLYNGNIFMLWFLLYVLLNFFTLTQN